MYRPNIILLSLAALWLPLVSAHTIFTTLFIDEVSQGDGTCVRMSPTPEHGTDPVPDLLGKDMACGVGGQDPVAFTCPAPAGGKLTFQWRMWANAEQPGVIDISHKGPCAIYAKHLDNMNTGSAAGTGWIKLWHEGHDASTGKWCTEKLIENDGLMSFILPLGLPAGNWLFRPELLALHDRGDPQFYVGCAQVFVESSVKTALDVPADYIARIPGYVTYDEPAITFNIYEPEFPYPMPGPKVYKVSAPSIAVQSSGNDVTLQTSGRVPASAICKNGNWVGFEVPSYSTQDGCWTSAEKCWDQCEACYDSAPSTGSANCQVFEKRCSSINDACDAGEYSGPPDRGVKLESADPPPPDYFPVAVNTDDEGGEDDVGDGSNGNEDEEEDGGDGESGEDNEGEGEDDEEDEDEHDEEHSCPSITIETVTAPAPSPAENIRTVTVTITQNAVMPTSM